MDYARSLGAVPVACNFRCRQGEIDLILKDGGYLVFAEVKYRANDQHGQAIEAIGPKKRQTICRVSRFYLQMRRMPEDTPVRYDVFAIDGDRIGTEQIRWVKDAFPYVL